MMGVHFARAAALRQVHDEYIKVGPESARELLELLILRNYQDHEELLAQDFWQAPAQRTSYERAPFWKPPPSNRKRIAWVRERREVFQLITGITNEQVEKERWDKLINMNQKEPTTASTPTNEPAGGGSL